VWASSWGEHKEHQELHQELAHTVFFVLLVVEHCATGCDDMMWLHRLHAVHGGLHAVHGGLHRLYAVHGGGCLLPWVNEPERVRM
jgi:hypothetical protein